MSVLLVDESVLVAGVAVLELSVVAGAVMVPDGVVVSAGMVGDVVVVALSVGVAGVVVWATLMPAAVTNATTPAMLKVLCRFFICLTPVP